MSTATASSPATAPSSSTAHDSAYRAALDLKKAGVEIALIVDLRPSAEGRWPKRARRGHRGRDRRRIVGAPRPLRVTPVAVAPVIRAASRQSACDAICVLMSGGWTPSVHLFSQSRGKLVSTRRCSLHAGRRRAARALGRRLPRHLRSAARARRRLRAGARRRGARVPAPAREALRSSRSSLERTAAALGARRMAQDPQRSRKAFVDFQNDVTAKDIELAVREGMRSIEHVKRYTTTGMATDQGKTSNMNALGIAAEALGKPIPEVGLTTFRPPYTPVTFGAFAGIRARRSVRSDPPHADPRWAARNGARVRGCRPVEARLVFSRKRGEDMHDGRSRANAGGARARRHVRRLDARQDRGRRPRRGEFMNRMYVNAWTKLEPGAAATASCCARTASSWTTAWSARSPPTASTSPPRPAARRACSRMMEDYLQTEWPDLNVWLTSTTEQWAVIAVQGPEGARDAGAAGRGHRSFGEAMPHMSVREGRICGVPTRLFRSASPASWLRDQRARPITAAPSGRRSGARAELAAHAYGTEAMHVLRAEKGYIIVGQETDGTVTPDDAGLDLGDRQDQEGFRRQALRA
jgi:sarcosine oxidase subunit alpha